MTSLPADLLLTGAERREVRSLQAKIDHRRRGIADLERQIRELEEQAQAIVRAGASVQGAL